jgi:hypothetical protein
MNKLLLKTLLATSLGVYGGWPPLKKPRSHSTVPS